jgi:hypothetical protein
MSKLVGERTSVNECAEQAVTKKWDESKPWAYDRQRVAMDVEQETFECFRL